METTVCFIGGSRYSRPLDATHEKKFRALASLGKLFVIGFCADLCPRRFVQHARFYLFPEFPLPVVRYFEMIVVGPLVLLWLILRHRIQVAVAQSPYEGAAAALAKKISGWFGHKVVLVVESHGDFEESLFLQRRVPFPRLYRFLMRHAARFSLRHADLLRSISGSTRHQLEQWQPGKPMFQFPTWTDIEVFLKAGLNGERRRSLDIIYVGVLIPRKGVDHLIRAFACVSKDFSESRLVLVGHEDNKGYAAELKTQVKHLGLGGRVQFVGAMPQAELAAWMRKACVFVLPSVSEGLGLVVVEAMATGIPVIGSNVGGIPEMVEDGVTGFLVQPGNEGMLAEKIRWVLKHLDETQAMGRHARAFAERFFSTQAYVDGYRQIFEAVGASSNEQREHAPSTL